MEVVTDLDAALAIEGPVGLAEEKRRREENHGAAGLAVSSTGRRLSERGDNRAAVKQGANADSSIGLREWLDELPEGNDTLFAAFDTLVEMVRRLPGSAAKAAAKVASKRGYQPLTRPESFYVQDTPGPLLDGEVQRAEVWGAQLAESLVGEVRDWG